MTPHAEGCICYWCIERDVSLGVESGVLEIVGYDADTGSYTFRLTVEEGPWAQS